MPRKDLVSGHISAQAQQELVSDGIENFELPKSLVTKIAKSAIPENAKLQKETVLSLVKGSTVFINYLAATAHGVALSKQHKSISASDVLKALEIIEFGDLVDKLQNELVVYRQLSKTDKTKTPRLSSTSVSAPGPPRPATTTKSKGKEREKPTLGLPPPFTSTPLYGPIGAGAGAGAGGMAPSISSAVVPGQINPDVDWEIELGEAADAADGDVGKAKTVGGEGGEDVEAELEGAVDEAEAEAEAEMMMDDDVDDAGDEEDMDEEEGGEEEPEDLMEVEELEMRKDSRGLEGAEDVEIAS